jgi:DNA-binding MarR family transcriptional regulator
MGRAPARSSSPAPDPTAGLAFLLSQVGAHASGMFADRLEPLGLTPPQVGILCNIAWEDGLSQQALSEKLGLFPSRLVVMIDELEQRGLVERRDSPRDRRSYALYLTGAGREALEQIEQIGRAHQQTVCAALDASEQAQLKQFLTRIAAEQKLEPGVHPGYRRYGGAAPKGP